MELWEEYLILSVIIHLIHPTGQDIILMPVIMISEQT